MPVLTHQDNGQFEFVDCYFMEFFVTADTDAMEKINVLSVSFDFGTGVKYAISKQCVSGNVLRLFLLAGPDIVKNNFTQPDDFLALALCEQGQKRTVIKYFEVNRKFRHSYEPDQKYRRVGTSTLNALKKIYEHHELCGKSAMEALRFWIKNGFTRINEQELDVYWRQKSH